MARPRTQAAPAARKRATQVKSKDRATSSVAARRTVLKRIKDEGVEHVLFWFTDLEGHLKSFAITPNEMEDAHNDGMGFDGSCEVIGVGAHLSHPQEAGRGFGVGPRRRGQHRSWRKLQR